MKLIIEFLELTVGEWFSVYAEYTRFQIGKLRSSDTPKTNVLAEYAGVREKTGKINREEP